MNKSDIKLIVNYLHRFVEPPIFSKQKWVSFWRYAGMAMSLVGEKIMGVDYTMVYYTKEDSDYHHSVYTKVPKKVLKRIFADITDIEEKAFIDVGCGKGYAVVMAARRGFGVAGGVEYAPNLYRICINNLKKKGLPTNHVYNGDAKNFKKYADFNVFFFNNPFDETILGPVAKRIYESHKDCRCVIYFLNPCDQARTDAIIDAGFKLVRQIPDPYEWYFDVNVYEN